MKFPPTSVRDVALSALYSRLIIVVLVFALNKFIMDYDTSSAIAFPTKGLLLDSLVQQLTSGLTKWDSVYFARIAEFGYEFEQTHAFFPLLPFLSRLVSDTGTNESGFRF